MINDRAILHVSEKKIIRVGKQICQNKISKKSRKLKKKKNRLTSAAAERKPRAERDLYVNTNLTVREKFARNVHFQFYE